MNISSTHTVDDLVNITSTRIQNCIESNFISRDRSRTENDENEGSSGYAINSIKGISKQKKTGQEEDEELCTRLLHLIDAHDPVLLEHAEQTASLPNVDGYYHDSSLTCDATYNLGNLTFQLSPNRYETYIRDNVENYLGQKFAIDEIEQKKLDDIRYLIDRQCSRDKLCLFSTFSRKPRRVQDR